MSCADKRHYVKLTAPFLSDESTPPSATVTPVYRTWHTNGRGTEQLGHLFGLIDLLPWGRQEEWQDSPDGWPQAPTYSNWSDSPDIAKAYGPR